MSAAPWTFEIHSFALGIMAAYSPSLLVLALMLCRRPRRHSQDDASAPALRRRVL